MVTDWIKETDKFILYGAQVIAVGAYTAIKHLTGREPESFAVGKPRGIVSFPTGNPEEIEGIPVRSIEEIAKDTYIVVAVTELIQEEVLPFLRENGYKNVFALTQHEEHLLMAAYFSDVGEFPLAEKGTGADETDLMLYEVMNDRDKALSHHPKLLSYERSIQAGAMLTGMRIADITDDTGTNISERNRMYCEMTAVYWVWKNTNHSWVGIEHYRRHLLVTPDMLNEDVDVILPLPYICYPNEVSQFLRFTTEDILEALLKALKAVCPMDYDRFHEILYGKYQYTYNLVCARREVFDEYCRWFFSITEYMETLGDEFPKIRETRALSYVAEVLTNLYFMRHQKDLRICHTERAIYT